MRLSTADKMHSYCTLNRSGGQTKDSGILTKYNVDLIEIVSFSILIRCKY